MYRLITAASAIAIALPAFSGMVVANPESGLPSESNSAANHSDCQSSVALRKDIPIASPPAIAPPAYVDPDWDSLQYED